MAVSDRILVMSRGHVQQIGTPEEVYRSPATAFVASFVGRSSAFDAVVQAAPGSITAHGVTLQAEAARGLLYGTTLRAFVRPEDVRLGVAAAGLPGAVPMTVTHLEFLGPTCRLSLERGAFRLEADLPPDQVRDAGALPGAEVLAAVPPDRIMVFPADE